MKSNCRCSGWRSTRLNQWADQDKYFFLLPWWQQVKKTERTLVAKATCVKKISLLQYTYNLSCIAWDFELSSWQVRYNILSCNEYCQLPVVGAVCMSTNYWMDGAVCMSTNYWMDGAVGMSTNYWMDGTVCMSTNYWMVGAVWMSTNYWILCACQPTTGWMVLCVCVCPLSMDGAIVFVPSCTVVLRVPHCSKREVLLGALGGGRSWRRHPVRV